jgi:hypothetical protein
VGTLESRSELPPRSRAEHRRLLDFLAEPRWLAGEHVYSDEQKEALKALPIFLTADGEIVSLGEGVYRPAHTPPAFSGAVQLLDLGKGNRWLPLFEFLGVPRLDAETLIRQFILPRYEQLDPGEKTTALGWIRDHLDTARTEMESGGKSLFTNDGSR